MKTTLTQLTYLIISLIFIMSMALAFQAKKESDIAKIEYASKLYSAQKVVQVLESRQEAPKTNIQEIEGFQFAWYVIGQMVEADLKERLLKSESKAMFRIGMLSLMLLGLCITADFLSQKTTP
jgi:hypothetical protein